VGRRTDGQQKKHCFGEERGGRRIFWSPALIREPLLKRAEKDPTSQSAISKENGEKYGRKSATGGPSSDVPERAVAKIRKGGSKPL